jgi:hypothetical protein
MSENPIIKPDARVTTIDCFRGRGHELLKLRDEYGQWVVAAMILADDLAEACRLLTAGACQELAT